MEERDCEGILRVKWVRRGRVLLPSIPPHSGVHRYRAKSSVAKYDCRIGVVSDFSEPREDQTGPRVYVGEQIAEPEVTPKRTSIVTPRRGPTRGRPVDV